MNNFGYSISGIRRAGLFIFIIILLASNGWEEVKYFPEIGDLEGKIVDNNGTIVIGAGVSATLVESSDKSSREKMLTTATDVVGKYQFRDLWDEIVVRAEWPLSPIGKPKNEF